jgi:hypothetical protein
VGAAGFFPARATQATLGTFTCRRGVGRHEGNVSTSGLTERALWSDQFFTETTFEVHSYNTE